MPLLDHFRSPIKNRGSWEGFHGMWPGCIVQDLIKVLPDHYVAEPRVHLGAAFEIDVCTFEPEDAQQTAAAMDHEPGGTATATWAPPEPTLVVDADPTQGYEYEVLIFDHNRARQLVAAIELASPGNMDRPRNRRAFVAKCAALLQQRVCVSIVDLVTTAQFNLYNDLLAEYDQVDAAFQPPPSTYAVTCRSHWLGDRARLESWAYPLIVGQPLPTLPIWLDDEFAVALNLEASYQTTCKSLRLV